MTIAMTITKKMTMTMIMAMTMTMIMIMIMIIILALKRYNLFFFSVNTENKSGGSTAWGLLIFD